jgi:hypothetical protein
MSENDEPPDRELAMPEAPERLPLSGRDYVREGRSLDSLRVQFDAVADELAFELCTIANWLAVGAWDKKPKEAFTACTLHMNEVRYLMGEIEAVTQRTERGTG